MKVILATGAPRLNTKIEKKFEGLLEVVGAPLFREAVEKTVSRTNAEVLIISDELEGVISLEELIKLMRARYPKTRIIFISAEISPDFKSFLYKLNVFDILNGSKFTVDELKNALYVPKKWTDVSKEIEGLEGFQKDHDDARVNKRAIHESSKIDSDYEKIKPIASSSNSLYQEFIAFWSVLDQTGKTFTAVNTSLFLASNKDLKVLLLDFNTRRPNVHFQFGFQDMDGNHNLGALIEDFSEEDTELTPKDLDKYLVAHPTYSNLKFLPGNILRMSEVDPETYIKTLERIYKAAQASNYTTILIDMDSGLRDPLSVAILRNVTKIFLLTNENPGAFYASRKMFDPEIGEFVPNLLNKKKIYPIITRTTDEYRDKFKHILHIELDLESNRTIATFKEDINIHHSIFEGAPIMKKPTPEYYQLFAKISNTIHPGFFKIKTKSTKQPPENKPTGIGGLFTKGKKTQKTPPSK